MMRAGIFLILSAKSMSVFCYAKIGCAKQQPAYKVVQLYIACLLFCAQQRAKNVVWK